MQNPQSILTKHQVLPPPGRGSPPPSALENDSGNPEPMKNTRKNKVFGPPAGGVLDVLEALGGVLEGLEGVLEALGGVLKAKMSQDSVKMGPRTRQERNPRELPSGLSPPSRRSQVQRALSRAACGGARPGLSSFLRKNITRKKNSTRS